MPTDPDEFLGFRRVRKTYPRSRTPALWDLDLAVRRGEIVALVGESGSGKSTLLRLAAGLEEPDAGSIRIAGRPVADRRVWLPPERRPVGLVFQEGALFPHRTVAGNIAFGLNGPRQAQRKQIVAELLDRVGLAGYQQRFPHELSGGERQRVALARALAPEPQIILLDEPFSNLDVSLRTTLRDDVCDILRRLGTTVILVAHDPEDALSVGDRVAILRNGLLEQVAVPFDAYHHPAGEYCARLFGPVNDLGPNHPAGRWLRPEQFRLTPDPSAAAVAARVLRIREIGLCRELTVQPDAPTAPEWTLRDTDRLDVQPGATVHITIRLPAPSSADKSDPCLPA